jgi:hypothetical protein
MRELSAVQADDLYELVSERAAAGRSMILTSNRSPVDWYPLFPNPVVAESLLDRLVNTSHQVFMNGPSYRPNKRPAPPPSPRPNQRRPSGRRSSRTHHLRNSASAGLGNYVNVDRIEPVDATGSCPT